MLRQVIRSPFDCLGKVTEPARPGSSPSLPSLPPLSGLPPVHWQQMNKLQRPSGPVKPLLRDRLRRLPDAPLFNVDSIGSTEDFSEETDDGKGGGTVERRIRFLEHSLKFLRQEHEDMLSGLHDEIDRLRRVNQDLQFRLVMAEEQIVVDKRRNMLAQTLEREKRIKQEAAAREKAEANRCEAIDKVIVGLPRPGSAAPAWIGLPQNPPQPGTNYRSCECVDPKPTGDRSPTLFQDEERRLCHAYRTAPLLTPRPPPKLRPCHNRPHGPCGPHVETDSSGTENRTPTPQLVEYRNTIRQLQTDNQRQATELNQLRRNFYDIVRTQKLTPDMVILARAAAALNTDNHGRHVQCTHRAANNTKQQAEVATETSLPEINAQQEAGSSQHSSNSTAAAAAEASSKPTNGSRSSLVPNKPPKRERYDSRMPRCGP